jgi:outer membrane lipoprotein-sorting protein
MKKLTLVLTGLFLIAVVNSQTLDEIIKKFSVANKQDKVASLSTIKITAKMSMSGMEIPMEMWMKNPDKIKTVTRINGQEIVAVLDGGKGYQVNPMAGSGTPVEMTPDQVKQTQNSNIFQNYMSGYLKNGQLSLEGEDKVNDKPAFKIKVKPDGGNISYMFIDKESYLLVKTSTTVNQGGTTMVVDSYPSNYTETNGVLLPMKTTTSASGMEFVITYDKVEVNIPMDDSIFKIK